MSQPGRETGKSIQVAVRLPKALYARMRGRGTPIARQLIDAIERETKGDAGDSPQAARMREALVAIRDSSASQWARELAEAGLREPHQDAQEGARPLLQLVP